MVVPPRASILCLGGLVDNPWAIFIRFLLGFVHSDNRLRDRIGLDRHRLDERGVHILRLFYCWGRENGLRQPIPLFCFWESFKSNHDFDRTPFADLFILLDFSLDFRVNFCLFLRFEMAADLWYGQPASWIRQWVLCSFLLRDWLTHLCLPFAFLKPRKSFVLYFIFPLAKVQN